MAGLTPTKPLPAQAPFTSPVLAADTDGADHQEGGEGADPSDKTLADLFPASFRYKEDVVAPADVPAPSHLSIELDPRRLHRMTHLLWLAGRPVPPRPLHHQRLLGREIVVSERVDMHMVWGQGRIFVKPLPRYLLDPRFWTEVLVCACGRSSSSPTRPRTVLEAPDGRGADWVCGVQRLRACATGLLVHYAALVAHESDFAIAREKHLVPAGVTWPRWRRFVREVLRTTTSVGGIGTKSDDKDEMEADQRRKQAVYADVAERFIYGELRLNRLNLIQLARRGPFSRHLLAPWNSYGSFFRANWALIVGATAWILLVLSAMQVGLGTARLADDAAFQAASYGFTVFSILGPMAIFTLMMGVFAAAMVHNLLRTMRFEREREAVLGRTWRTVRREDLETRKFTILSV